MPQVVNNAAIETAARTEPKCGHTTSPVWCSASRPSVAPRRVASQAPTMISQIADRDEPPNTWAIRGNRVPNSTAIVAADRKRLLSRSADSRLIGANRPPGMSLFNVFFDNPARRPYKAHRASLALKTAKVTGKVLTSADQQKITSEANKELAA